jgi:quercetin dioxygenase-like cupin family protein/heme-degrading monooxygenase HmoA
MSVLMTMRMHGNGERLEEAAAADPAKLRSITDYAEHHGLISHQFWATDGDIMVVDEWASRQDFENFMRAEDAEIKGVMGSAGVTDQPEVTYWRKLDTHDEVAPGHDTGDTGSGLRRASFDQPEETRPFEDGMGRMDLLAAGGGLVGRAVFEPGWRWSSHVKPIAGTESCLAAHMGYLVSGQMVVRMDDGQEERFVPGDLMIAPPGHDAWVVGDEACVVIDWQGVADYAKR